MNEKLLELQNDVKRKIASKKPIFHDFMAIGMKIYPNYCLLN